MSGHRLGLRENYTFEFGRLHNEAFETPVDHPSVVAFDSAISRFLEMTRWLGWIASCDARLFSRRGTMPTITFGPGDLGHAHSLNEQIKVDDILRAAEVLVLYLTDWCGVNIGGNSCQLKYGVVGAGKFGVNAS